MPKGFVGALCCLLLIAALPLVADEWDKKTTVTFNQPVDVPGLVLLPGTYTFKLMNSSSDRHIVTIYNEEGTRLYTTVLTINNYRVNRTSDTVFKFTEERTVGAPQALRGWFWPGDNWGQEFVYPKVQARAIAETVKEPVLSAEVKPAEPAEELIQGAGNKSRGCASGARAGRACSAVGCRGGSCSCANARTSQDRQPGRCHWLGGPIFDSRGHRPAPLRRTPFVKLVWQALCCCV